MLHPAPLLALDWIQIAILLFLVVSSLVGQLIKTNQDRQRKAAGRPAGGPAGGPAGPRPAPRQPAPQPNVNRPRGPLQQEIDTFLRRATGQPSAEAEVVAAEVVPEPVVASRAPTLQQRPTAFDQPLDEPSPYETVAEHVARHLHHTEGGLQQRDAHLGSVIEQADEQMEDRLEQRFEHTVGRLASTSTSAEAPQVPLRTDTSAAQTPSGVGVPTSARELAQLLRSPRELANAIVLTEILKRPVDRWS